MLVLQLFSGTMPSLLSKLKTLSPKLLAVTVTPLDGADQVNSKIMAAAHSEGVNVIKMGIQRGLPLEIIFISMPADTKPGLQSPA